jgi:hypothetical protein
MVQRVDQSTSRSAYPPAGTGGGACAGTVRPGGRGGGRVGGTSRPWRRREVSAVVAVAAAVTALLLATANPGPSLVNDTRASALSSWTLGTQGELALPEPWPASRNYWGVTTPDGRVHVNRFPGVALWAAPAYAVHHLAVGRPDPPAHPFLVDLRPAGWAAASTVVVALVVAYALLRREVPPWWAAGGVLVLGLGTSLWSVAADALWPHGPAVLALLTVLLACRRGGRGDPVLAAAAAAVAVSVRPHLAVATVVLGVGAVWRGRRASDALASSSGSRAGERAAGVGVLVGTVVGLAVVSGYTRRLFGTWLPIAGYDVAGHLGGLVEHSPWQTVRAFGLALVGSERGVLVWSPVLAVAVVCLVVVAVAGRDRLPGWTVTAAAAGMAYLVVQVRAVGHLGGADFFGARITLEPVVLATPLLVVACWQVVAGEVVGPVLRRVAAGLLAVAAAGSIGWHAFGAAARSTSPEQLERWEAIDATVRRDFGHLRLGDVDLREQPGTAP